ncbi:hypothetical protein GNI_132060 [Gregarina niphandrodes]|uniref:ER membrane protein complex subunit 2 n=1 Tax=Gregarina niphandrodes TaxID=110365 RepID=A0A023B1D5_GRENI|nr:hypothetical protein GNI_132060 [Gregarina niphandrodes]EZG47206.1 hypothetical protein GNI_132060 [Gregarina niphandrodes]|eukprot:XP_011132201.1 hypothetical protein GNI_132060 [Gregarina niphandrodes]
MGRALLSCGDKGVNQLKQVRHLDSFLFEMLKASVAVGDDELALTAYCSLKELFPESAGLKKLAITCLQAVHRTDAVGQDRLDVASKSLDPAETDMSYRRAILTAMRTSEHSHEYKDLVEKYLEDCPSDVAAWKDRLSIALNETDLERARFAAEQIACILCPMNMGAMIQLADVCFAQGHLVAAAKYYCLVIAFEPNWVRALGGLVITVCEMMKTKGVDYSEMLLELTKVALKGCGRLTEIFKSQAASTAVGDNARIWAQAQLELFDQVKNDIEKVTNE